jgi:hypothetical protein
MKVPQMLLPVVLTGMLMIPSVFGQAKPPKIERRPPLSAATTAQASTQPAPNYEFFSILDGLPMLLDVHHDTEVGTNRPINVYVFVIEMQIMNSDGNLEPVGLQIHNYFTVYAQDAKNDVNPRNGRDCHLWNGLVLSALKHRDPKSPTWPYVEFMTAEGARMVQTNEDGPVWWSDDIQCWGSSDRFSPF